MIHTVYDITDCANPDPPSTELLQAMHATARLLGCTVLGELPITFQPHGTTCVVVLAESHLTVSTWPEERLAHIDLFTCRADTHPDDSVAPVLAALGGGTVTSQRINRRGPGTITMTAPQPTAAR